MTLQEIGRLQASAHALAAIGAALDARLAGRPTDPYIAAVLEALGLSIDGPAHELEALLGEIRALSLSNASLLFRSDPGWYSQDPRLLRAAGDVSIAFPHALRDRIAPRLDGLADRLAAAGATFLDVGVGVARMSIEMTRVFPTLRVVGIDPFAPALAIARENVAGLEDRIELREQAGEDLLDSRAFDLAWVAGAFVPHTALPVLLERVHAALKPGGWLLLAAFRPADDPLQGALTRLRAATFAGAYTPLSEMEALVAAAGFDEISVLPSAPTAATVLVAARRTMEGPATASR